MTHASMKLNIGRNDLMRLSVIRSNAMQSAFNDIMSEFPKCIDIQGVPHDFRAEYQENVRDLRQAFQRKWGEMISNLGVLEQQHRSEVDSMYATATYALAGELAAAESQRRLLSPPHGLVHLLSPPTGLVRQHASSTGFKRQRPSRAGDSFSESESDENECEEADLEAAKADADDPAGETGVKPESDSQ
jgi:hypothetical protein